MKRPSWPLSGANVRVGDQVARTDDSGETTFQMEVGSYPFRVMADGYEGGNGTVDVTADEDARHVEILKPAQASGSVIFSVLDENTAKGIEKAKIAIGKDSVETGTAGLAVIVLPPGNYVYKFSAPGYKQASASLTMGEDDDANIVELMTPDGSTTGSVFVTVSDENTAKGTKAPTSKLAAHSVRPEPRV